VRPWIEFVQSQRLPWRADDLWSLRPGVEIKTLSRDETTGAASIVVRYPAGFSATGGAWSADEEFLVLEGELQIGKATYGYLSYGHWPAGYSVPSIKSPNGAVVLTFFSGHPKRLEHVVEFRRDRLVERMDGLRVPYTGNFHPQFPPGAGRKKLYQDPVTHDTSWLLGTLPLRWSEAAEVHPMVEEMYLISGEVHGNRGIMRPGAYFWRPAGTPHGPYGTLTGNLYFFRSKGGALTTDYVAPEQSFRWWPKYDPVLPDHLHPFRGEVSAGSGCW
jgi:hypothetical protein